MTEPFVANNGLQLFLDERDKELGLWRWPENPDYVIRKKRKSGIRVMRESDGVLNDFTRALIYPRSDDSAKAAQAYYETHPEHPWEGSPVGSVWKIVAASPGHHALIWLSNYRTWDILGPKGESFVGSENPIATLTENGYPGFEDYQSAKELKET